MTIDTDCTEPAPSHVQSMVLRSMADSHSNDEVRSMARELLSARSRIAELESRQPQSAEWVPWKEGDPLPPDGLYWATFRYTSAAGNPNSVPRCEVKQVGFGYWQTNAEILAYIPQRLPDPYTDAQGKRLPEREECEK